ncbi:Cobalt-zinc-cadmium resistance protein CzcB [compost metagenome]
MKTPKRILAWLLIPTVVLAACSKPAEEATKKPRDAAATEEHTQPGEAHGPGEEGQHAEGEAGHTDGEDAGGGAHNENAVSLKPESQRIIGLATEPAQLRPVKTVFTTTGEIEANANREAHVTTRVPGRVVKVAKNVGDRVGAGETLAVLDSVELGEAQSTYLEAIAKYDLARSTHARQQRLYRDELIAQKEVIAASNALRLAQIDVNTAKNRLELLGFTPARIAALASGRRLDPTVPLLSPIRGVVIARHLTIGEVLEPRAEQPAFTVSDISELWVNATLYERDLARVHQGQSATITTPAYPGKVYRGRVSVISTGLEKETRTATARIVVANPDGLLKPDMAADVRIEVGSQSTLAVPSSAIVKDKDDTYVFIRKGPESFERRPVEAGEPVGGLVPITKGLTAGEEVVVKGGFSLKAELSKEEFGEHGH